MVLQDLLEEGAAEADLEGEEQEGEEEEGASCNNNYDVTVMVFRCSMNSNGSIHSITYH